MKTYNPRKIAEEAEKEFYQKLVKLKPKNISIDNQGEVAESHNNTVDALRHAYVSGILGMSRWKAFTKIIGDLYEFFYNNPSEETNMDKWNNAIGRKYAKLVSSNDQLFDKLLVAMDNGELITNPIDPRVYVNDDSLNEKIFPGKVIVVNESNTGENLIFYDPRNGMVMSAVEFVAAIKVGKYPMYEIRVINQKETPVSKKDGINSNNLD